LTPADRAAFYRRTDFRLRGSSDERDDTFVSGLLAYGALNFTLSFE